MDGFLESFFGDSTLKLIISNPLIIAIVLTIIMAFIWMSQLNPAKKGFNAFLVILGILWLHFCIITKDYKSSKIDREGIKIYDQMQAFGRGNSSDHYDVSSTLSNPSSLNIPSFSSNEYSIDGW